MRKRAERAQVWLTLEEKEDLRAKASAACMDEGRFIRMLIKGYAPRPAPDDQFFKIMELIRTMGDRLELMESRITDPQVQQLLQEEAKKWHAFQHTIEQRYLLPERMEQPWQ
ncbi:MAG: hypothetical protein Q3987_09055 [Oscillospiraceae bacterium]|nr:hypothetical protein [Lachnospiraceae bacterium]MDO4877515.1 hypothetical protein [Oscillospiraceae bacterium]